MATRASRVGSVIDNALLGICFLGSVIPFPKDKLLPRDEYLGRFTADTLKLVEERYLVKEDVYDLVKRAGELYEWVSRASLPDHHGREQ